MKGSAETLLRRALAEGCVTVAELQGFGQMDYAGVARILKLDADLRETIVAVKLQEIGGDALLALQPTDFASTLSLTEPEQGERLEAFLSALKKVAADPNGCVQPQQAAATTADGAGIAAVTATKKRRGSEPEAGAAAAPVQRKAPVHPKGLHGPRVSGLKRPPPTAPAVERGAAAGAPVPLPATAAAPRAGVTQLQQQSAEPFPLQENQGSSLATDASKRQRQKKEKIQGKATSQTPRGEPQVKKQPRIKQQKLSEQQQPAAASLTKGKSHRRAKLMAWAASILALKGRFDSELRRQAACRTKRALLSTTGFTEGAGVQNELPALVRRLGSWDGVPAAFEWKPQYPEKITHLICSNELVRPTVKLYFALVNGAFILREEFLQEVRKQKVWPDPYQFQRPDFPSVEQRKSRWLLRGLPICIDGPYRPAGLSKQQLQSLVLAAGGVLGDDASATVRMLEDAEALRRRQARGLWGFQGDAGAQPVAISSQWLLDCVRSWQLLPRDQHVLNLSSPTPNNLDGNATEGAQKRRRKEAKTGISQSKKEKTGRGRKMPPDCIGESCGGSTHREGSKLRQEDIVTLQIQVEKPQEVLGRHPDEAASKENARSTASPTCRQQQEQADPSYAPPKALHRGAAGDVAQQAIKKRSSTKRLRNEEKSPHENVSRKKKMLASSPVAEKQDITERLHAADTFPERGGEVAAAAGDEAVVVPLGAAAESQQQSRLISKPTKGTPAGEAGCSDNEEGLAASPVVGDWEPPEVSPAVEERAAAEGESSSSANPVAEAAHCPQRDCPASTSQATAARDTLQLPEEHLDVTGLFEPDEADASGYNFDLKDHCSLGQKFEDIHTNGPANTQREAIGESHLNENLPGNNSEERMGHM